MTCANIQNIMLEFIKNSVMPFAIHFSSISFNALMTIPHVGQGQESSHSWNTLSPRQSGCLVNYIQCVSR